jgi:altronate dehydratase large subunit
MTFEGYPRPDGTVGVRNHVVVMSSVSCANGVVSAIARECPEIKSITHTEGCGRGLTDLPITERTLVGLGRNPNAAAILVVGLGCEFVRPDGLAEQIKPTGKPVEFLFIQEEGGSQKTARKGIEIARRFLDDTRSMKRETFGLDKLTMGLKCGGSDAMSGVTANPMVGVASDWLVSQGGTVILSETTEMFGAEAVLGRKAASPEVRQKLLDTIERQKQQAKRLLGPFAGTAVSPGNVAGGLTTLAEKSLGCVMKAGTTPIQEVIEYAAAPSKKGLVVMDTPGSDIFSLTGMAAGGAQILVFTTGRGTPAGFPIAPVIKIASNTALFESMNDDMDLDAGKVLDGVPIQEAGQGLIEFVAQVAAGRQTKAEINQQDLLAIYTVEQAF